MKILVNEAHSIARKRKATVPLEDMPVESGNSDMLESYELRDAVRQLSAEFRTVTILFYYEDMSIREISKILNLPQGTVNSRLNRSREKLKTIFTSMGAT